MEVNCRVLKTGVPVWTPVLAFSGYITRPNTQPLWAPGHEHL